MIRTMVFAGAAMCSASHPVRQKMIMETSSR